MRSNGVGQNRETEEEHEHKDCAEEEFQLNKNLTEVVREAGKL